MSQKKPDSYDIPEQLRQNKPDVHDFGKDDRYSFAYWLSEKCDTEREPHAWFP